MRDSLPIEQEQSPAESGNGESGREAGAPPGSAARGGAPEVLEALLHAGLLFGASLAFGLCSGLLVGDPTRSQPITLGHLAVLQIAVVGGTTALLVARSGVGWRAVLGRARTAWLAAVLAGTPGFVLLATPVLDSWAGAFGWSEPEWYEAALRLDGLGAGAAVLAAVCVAPAVCEELFFRGYLLQRLRGGLGAPAAVVLQALVFAAYHLDPFGLPVYLASGLLLGVLRVWSGALWPCVLFHLANNVLGVLDYDRGITLYGLFGEWGLPIGVAATAAGAGLAFRAGAQSEAGRNV